MDSAQLALLELAKELRQTGYRFTAITPESHRRVNARPGHGEARSVRDVFGWSRPFVEALLPAPWLQLLDEGGALERAAGLCRSRVRFSTLGNDLFVHSAFPTVAADAVFFGPDTYRFATLLRRALPEVNRLVDLGCGSGAGALSVRERVGELVLADVNPGALRLAEINAALADQAVSCRRSDLFSGVEGRFDAVIANPPYLVDEGKRVYRDGGGPQGIGLSVRIVTEGLSRLEPGGTLILYTASPVIDGTDVLERALEGQRARARHWNYQELDPDVFGEELERPAYAEVDRLSLVALIATV